MILARQILWALVEVPIFPHCFRRITVALKESNSN